MKKKLSQTMAVVVVSLIIVGVMLYFRLRSKPDWEEVVLPREQLTNIESRADVPIEKRLHQGKNGIQYLMQGEFRGEFVKIEGRPDTAYEGYFVVSGDPLERQIRVVFIESLFLGRFEGSFDSDSGWRRIDVEEVNDELVMGEEVLLQIDYELGDTETIPPYVLKTQEIIDKLISDFNKQEHGSEIPGDFFLVGQGMGVVR